MNHFEHAIAMSELRRHDLLRMATEHRRTLERRARPRRPLLTRRR
jgi:hypothetical protein